LPENVCPVRAVTLFELDELVAIAKDRSNGKYVVLVAGPCGECGATKKNALRPLLANERLRLWTHLIVDAKTAKELLTT
jgi:DNA-binding transcriptional regulator LsrR (DeoR family)